MNHTVKPHFLHVQNGETIIADTRNITTTTNNLTHNSQPSVNLSLVDITGRTRLSLGISETRENKNIADSSD